MIYRIPITRDNTISTWSELPTLRNFGNAGQSQICDVWAQYREDKNARYLTRFLAETNLTALQAAIAAGDVPDVTDESVTCNLKFFNINHNQPVAFEYTLQVFPVTRSWQEGRGIRIDSFTNTGYSCWASASNTAAWTSQGGDFDSSICSMSASQYFNSGSENLNVNIRKMLVNWLNGSSANYGFIVKMDADAENLTASTSTNTQYYRKSFHGRTTNFPNYAPYIQLEWSSLITDDRNIAQFGNNVNLYFYNAPNSNYSDIDGQTTSFPGKVTISGFPKIVTGSGTSTVTANNSVYSSLTPLRVKKGVYKANFVLPSSASVYTSFNDVWTITSAASAIALNTNLSFYPTSAVSADNNYVAYDIALAIPSWHCLYNKDSVVTKKVYFIENSANVEPLAQSEKNSISSVASSTLDTYISTSGWWRVVTDLLGVVDIDWQKLEYDSNSNFFTIDFSNFARYVKYQLEFKVMIRGETIIFDNKSVAQFYFEVN